MIQVPKLVDLIKGRKTSADWRAAIAELEQKREETGSSVSALEARRQRLLEEGTAKDIRELDEALAEHDLNLERIAARLDKVRPELEKAERRERAAHIESLRDAAVADYTEFLDAWAAAVAAASKISKHRENFDQEGVGFVLRSLPIYPPVFQTADILHRQRDSIAEFASLPVGATE